MPTLVLGIGNNLLTDEGAGVHAIAYLQQHHAALADTRFLDGGTLSFTLAEDIGAADQLIVVDATQLHAPAGTVRVYEDAEFDAFLHGQPNRSVHEVGLVDLLQIMRLTERLPQRRALVGIQPEILDWGETPTTAVAAAIPVACQHVVDVIHRWSHAHAR